MPAKTKRLILSLLLLITFTGCATRQKLRPPAEGSAVSLTQQIDRILQDSLLSQSQVGVKVISLKTGETLYAHNNEVLFHPASNMKLLTTAAALTYLGPDYRYRTEVYADSGSLQDSSVSGNIYLKGYGNPDLLSDDLRELILDLRNRGVRYISGDLVCDDSYMDDLYWGNGWMWDDVSAWYWAPINALSVNDNCVNLTVLPGDSIGAPLTYQLEPRTSYMQIENSGLTVADSDSLQRQAFAVERTWYPVPRNLIRIEGGRRPSDAPRRYVVDVVDAALYTGTLFGEMLSEAGIKWSGTVRRGLLPDAGQLLAKHTSEPLTLIVHNTNKASDNLSAELLLKTVGAEVKGAPGTADKGLSVIRGLLQEAGVDSSRYRIVDGSGVSRYNVITPNLITALLKKMSENFGVAAEYQSSLPIAALDGTLSGRMANSTAAGKLHAKTGSLSGVSALGGYTTTADGELLAFSIIMEHFLVGNSLIRAIQDKIGAALSGYRRMK